MPISYSVDHRRQRIHAVATGTVNVADLAAYIAARVKDGVYDYDQLIDLTEGQLDMGSQEALNVVRQARGNLAKKPIPYTAVVAKPGGATYGLARQLATLFDFEGASVHITGTAREAHQWLDEIRSEEGNVARERQGDT